MEPASRKPAGLALCQRLKRNKSITYAEIFDPYEIFKEHCL